MRFKTLHEWPTDLRTARKIQLKLNIKVINERISWLPETIGAVDTALDKESETLFASAVVFSFPNLTEIESTRAKLKAKFPYVSGLMTFREGPVILKALGKLKKVPDVIIYRGHGIAHPRFFGLASHLGVLTEIPSIGCAMEPLVGDFNMPPETKGKWTSVYFKDFEVGRVYRSRTGVKPIYISPGHLCSLRDAVNIIAMCLTSYRIPEPLRQAHRYANEYKRCLVDKSAVSQK